MKLLKEELWEDVKNAAQNSAFEQVVPGVYWQVIEQVREPVRAQVFWPVDEQVTRMVEWQIEW